MSRYDIIKDENLLVEVINGDTEKALKELTADGPTEKHVPYIEEKEDGYYVRIGENDNHPMTEEHWIEFIELIIDGSRVYRHYLSPSDKPETFFKVEKGSNVIAREYCNLHGLWKSTL